MVDNHFVLKKTLLSLFLLALPFFFAVSAVSAKVVRYTPAPTPVATPTPTPEIEKVNSFELLWPLAPGKTMTSKLYQLKLLKERIRGLLIFGKPQKANYKLLLGTKRLLEAEFLMNSSNKDIADKTLDLGIDDFNKTESNIEAARAGAGMPADIRAEMGDRVTRLTKLVKWLISQNKDEKDKLQTILDKLGQISSNL